MWNKSKNYWIFVGILALSFLLYHHVISFSLVRDDPFHLYKNPYLQKITAQNLVNIWTNVYWRLYIPVTYTTWAILKPIGEFISGTNGFHAPTYHLINIIIHAFNVYLLFKFIEALIKNKLVAAIAALLFLVHPLQVESVAWISELRGLLSALFGLILLNYHVSAYDEKRGKSKQFAVEILLLVLAVLSKPSAIVLPLVIIALDVTFAKYPVKKSLISSTPLLLVIIPISLVTILSQPGEEQAEIFAPLWIRPLLLTDGINFYLFKTLYPIDLATTYGRTNSFLSQQWWFYIQWLIPLVLLILVLKLYKHNPLYLFAYLFFVFGFLPVSGVIGHAYQAWSNVADRFVYFSMAGVAIATGVLLNEPRFRKSFIPFSIPVIFYVLLIVQTIRQVPYWRNELTLWEHAVDVVPGDHKVYLCRADEYMKRGNPDEALEDYNRSLAIKSTAEGYNSRGIVFYNNNEYAKALKDYNLAIELDPDYANVYNNRGNVYRVLKKYDRALKDYQKTVTLTSNDGRPYLNMGSLYLNLGKPQQALEHFNNAAALGVNSGELYYNRGLAYKALKKQTAAIGDFIKAINKNPKKPEAYYHLAQLYFFGENYPGVIKALNGYINLVNSNVDAYINRAKAYYFTNQPVKALEDLKKAQQMGGNVNPAFYQAVINNIHD